MSVYRTTLQADTDIADIYVSGAINFGREAAETYQAKLFGAFRLLGSRPHMARERLELGRGIRLYPFKAHVIVYSASEDGILIVRVLHGRQDWAAHIPL